MLQSNEMERVRGDCSIFLPSSPRGAGVTCWGDVLVYYMEAEDSRLKCQIPNLTANPEWKVGKRDARGQERSWRYEGGRLLQL
jgi:hypothetical protein